MRPERRGILIRYDLADRSPPTKFSLAVPSSLSPFPPHLVPLSLPAIPVLSLRKPCSQMSHSSSDAETYEDEKAVLASSGKVPTPITSANASDVPPAYHIETQEGISKVQAIQRVWGPRSKICLWVGVALASYIYSLDGTTTYQYQARATSTFQAHSLLGAVSTAQAIVLATMKPVAAKVSDKFGRAEAYALSVMFYVLGYIVVASSKSINDYAAGAILFEASSTLFHFVSTDLGGLHFREKLSNIRVQTSNSPTNIASSRSYTPSGPSPIRDTLLTPSVRILLSPLCEKPLQLTWFQYRSAALSLTLFAVLAGVVQYYTRRTKWLLVCGLCIRLLGVGLMIISRGANGSTGFLVVTQVLQGLGGGIASCACQLLAQASMPHQDLSTVTAFVLLFAEIGNAVGSSISAAIWRGHMPGLLAKNLDGLLNATAIDAIYGSIYTAASYPKGSPIYEGVISAYDDTMKVLLIAATCIAVIPIFLSLFVSDIFLSDAQNAVEHEDLAGRTLDAPNVSEKEVSSA
ncbi:hypothetical protein P7C70_g65, partial [Phenoliferia sp. Uapishka_3]